MCAEHGYDSSISIRLIRYSTRRQAFMKETWNEFWARNYPSLNSLRWQDQRMPQKRAGDLFPEVWYSTLDKYLHDRRSAPELPPQGAEECIVVIL